MFLTRLSIWIHLPSIIHSDFLSASERKELLGCVKRQTEKHGIARRASALLLLDNGPSFAQVAKVIYLKNDTVRGWADYKSLLRGARLMALSPHSIPKPANLLEKAVAFWVVVFGQGFKFLQQALFDGWSGSRGFPLTAQ